MKKALNNIESKMLANIKKQIKTLKWYRKQPAKRTKTLTKRAITLMAAAVLFAQLRAQHQMIRSQPQKNFPSGKAI